MTNNYLEIDFIRSVNMPLEQEASGLILAGFVFIIAATSISLWILWRRSGNKGLLWFLPQLVMLSVSMFFFMQLINNEVNIPSVMLSEENTLTVGMMCISWCLSMIFMVVGISGCINRKVI